MNIHPTAIVHPKAKLADDVKVDPYSIIGENVIIGSQSCIGTSCVIENQTTIGKRCRIFSGAVIGSIPQDLKFKGENSFLRIGNDNVIREYVTINIGTGEGGETSIGNNNLLMAYSHIAHDSSIGNSCIIANVGTLAGHVTIEDKAIVGGLVAIHQFVRVGSLSIIGGCSKVVKDIPPYSTCDGHPTKVYGLNNLGLKRAGVSAEIVSYLKRAFKILFNSGLSIPHALERIEEVIPKSPEVSHLIEFVKSSERGICK